MPTATMPAMARDPEAISLFRERVQRRDWGRAKRLAYVLGLHRVVEQRLMEADEVWLRRVARKFRTDG